MSPGFKPDEGSYYLSAWVFKPNSEEVSYEGVDITIDDVSDYTLTPSGPIIEGWQKIEDIVTLSGNTFTISFNKSNPLEVVLFDDFRLHPIDANMKSYVFDDSDHQLMAELDENNYATFYEYDEEGTLIRIKKETERGIVTIQESRKHVQKD